MIKIYIENHYHWRKNARTRIMMQFESLFGMIISEKLTIRIKNDAVMSQSTSDLFW